MGFWKVFGGITAGVCAVTAAPVFGAVGTVTLAGAAVGAAVGAIGGAATSKIADGKEYDRGFQKGKAQGKAEDAQQIKHMELMLRQAVERFKEHRQYEDWLIALFAVGVSVAHCDGHFDPREQEELEDFIAGMAKHGLPQRLKDAIDILYRNPPSFNSAMKFVKAVDKSLWQHFSLVIDMVSHADGHLRQEEMAYRQAWESFRMAA